MRMNALRTELNSIISDVPVTRRAAIRRSLEEEWLYATDLPVLCSMEKLEEVQTGLSEAGWEHMIVNGWLQTRKASQEPPEGWFRGPFGTEAACCLSLLQRNVSCSNVIPYREETILIRAGEEGAEAYEAACAMLHREWAEKLRMGKPLPSISTRYFGR